jgi:hypothetical protein
MNILNKILLFLSAILYHCRKVLLKHSEKKIKLRVCADYDAKNNRQVSLPYVPFHNSFSLSIISYRTKLSKH